MPFLTNFTTFSIRAGFYCENSDIKRKSSIMVTLAPSSTPRVGDFAIDKIEVKLTHLKKRKSIKMISF